MVVDRQHRSSQSDLLADLPRGRHAEHIGKPAQAYFESPENLLATASLQFDPVRNRESKILLGVVDGHVVTGPRLPDSRVHRWITGGSPLGFGSDQHLLTIASSRSGKSRSVILPTLYTLPAETSVVVIDPKGELARLTCDYRASLGQHVGLLDAFECSGPHAQRFSIGFNPIDVLLRSDRKTFAPNAKLIAESLILTENTKETHWPETARQACAMLCAHVATHPKYEGRRHLITVWLLAAQLGTPDPHNPRKYLLEDELLGNDAAGGMIQASALNFFSRAGGEFSSVLSTLNRSLDWISIECMEDSLCNPNSVDLRDLKRSSLALYITLPAMRMSDLTGWLRLVIQMTLAAFEEEAQSFGPPCILILDEFHSLGGLRALEDNIAQVAGLGARLWPILQDLNQLKRNHPKSFETFIANSGMIQAFGVADHTTLSYLSQLLGSSLAISHSTNAPTYEQATKQAASGESWSVTNHPLMTPEEVGRYFARDDKQLRQLILRPGYRPMITQRIFADKHELFRGKHPENRA